MTDIVPGVFGSIELLENNTKLKKTYIEDTERRGAKELMTISDKVIIIEPVSEHQAHEYLHSSMPTDYPKIYSYKETDYLSIPESERPPIPHILKNLKAKSEYLKVCEVVMDFINKPVLRDVITQQIGHNRSNAIKFLKSWFNRLLDMVQHAHILPNDFHIANILSSAPDDVNFIDYAFYSHFEVIDTITDYDIGYKLTPNTYEVSKYNIKTLEPLELKTSTFTRHDAELMFYDILRYELKRVSVYNCVHNSIWLLFQDETIDIFKDAMTQLKLSQEFQRLVIVSLTNGYYTKCMYESIYNWLGGGNIRHVSIHRILSFKMLNPKEYNVIEQKWESVIKSELKKLSADELVKYLDSHDVPKIERRLIYCYYKDYNPWKEQSHIYSFVVNNLTTVDMLYRVECTNRFSNTLHTGSEIKWDNFISATKLKEYALTFCNNDGENYLFLFIKPQAAHLHLPGRKYTTNPLSYNLHNPDDTNWLNFTTVNRIVISDEWILNPYTSYAVSEIKLNQTSTANVLGKSCTYKYTEVVLKVKE